MYILDRWIDEWMDGWTNDLSGGVVLHCCVTVCVCVLRFSIGGVLVFLMFLYTIVIYAIVVLLIYRRWR